jgi:cytochrome c oxidase cbb3-type subunit 4
MALDTLRGIVTAVLFVLFIALVAWAWSGKRRAVFQKMAQLPLEEDAGVPAAQPERLERNHGSAGP